MQKIYWIADDGYSDFIPIDAGREKCAPGHTFGPAIRNYYLIHFVISGNGRFEGPHADYSLSAGEAFLIRPGEVTTYRAGKANPWEYIWIGFNGALAERFSSLPDVFSVSEEFISELCEAVENDFGREALIASVIFKLYASLLGERESTDYPSRVMSYINAHYMDNVTISEISDSLGLNRKYLARIFKKKCGVTMQEYLINKRLHEGKKLLKLGYNVEECAYMVGYSDQFGFSKAFKQKYGKPPSEYK